MRLLGEQAISSPTRASGRSVLLISAILIMIQLDWANLDNLTVFEVGIAEGKAEEALRWFAYFLIFAHLVQWFGDYVSYRNWNVFGAEAALMRDIGGRKEQNKLTAILEDLHNFSEAHSKGEKPVNSSSEQWGYLVDDLKRLNRSVNQFNSYALFYVWIWHLGLPISVGAVAIYWSYYG